MLEVPLESSFPPEAKFDCATAPKPATSASSGQQKDNDSLPLRIPNVPDDLDHKESDVNSLWPRRLLHVPSMTSHKWRPGNTYNGIVNPKYSVISYSRGRWRIRDPSFISQGARDQSRPLGRTPELILTTSMRNTSGEFFY